MTRRKARKVYAANGELMDHFSGLDESQRVRLERGPGDAPVPSLANVLRLRRPMIIVDEAHNARTKLSFDVLARLAPSLIVEFTATPVTPDKADIADGVMPSNVLHHVLRCRAEGCRDDQASGGVARATDPNDTIRDAIAWLDELTDISKAEEAETREFVPPDHAASIGTKVGDRSQRAACGRCEEDAD